MSFKIFCFSILFALFNSCAEPNVDPSPPPDDIVIDYPFYEINIHNDSDSLLYTLIGDSGAIETSWSKDYGLIYLGTDTNHLPMGTLTLKVEYAPDLDKYEVLNATLSVTDVVRGTVLELNARTYVLDGLNHSFKASVSDESIKTFDFNADMVRSLPTNSAEPKNIKITAAFAAFKN